LRKYLKLAVVFFIFGAPLLLFALENPKYRIFKQPFKIGGQFFDYQNFNKLSYFHGGIDLVVPDGTNVYSPVDGNCRVNCYRILSSKMPRRFFYQRWLFNGINHAKDYNLEISITDKQGRNWMLRHIAPESIPTSLYKNHGTYIKKGTYLGKVFKWMFAVKPEKSLYNHIHLEILDKNKNYANPYPLVGPLPDKYPPVIEGVWQKNANFLAKSLSQRSIIEISSETEIIFLLKDRMDNSLYNHSVRSTEISLHGFSAENESVPLLRDKIFDLDKLPVQGDRSHNVGQIYLNSLDTENDRIFSNGHIGPRVFLVRIPLLSVYKFFRKNSWVNRKHLFQINFVFKDSNGNSSNVKIYCRKKF
jgi:hypothetical protein